ncbi:hypothetical protein LJC45_01385 [Alistipes sp. OttesenSCG-928-B03]|nr:hypothetical protein [Alistipes sp. OttesenSCG-928-B03]
MKLYRYIWIIVLAAVVTAGCQDEDDRLDKVVSDLVEFTETEVILPSAGRTESIIVTSDLGWTIEGESEWCTVSPTKGVAGTSTIYFTTTPNPEYDDRSVNFTLISGGKPTVLTVYQKKKDEIIFDKDKFDNIPMDGMDIEIAMSTNVDYTIDLPEGANEWIERLPSGTRGTRALERKTERFRIGRTDEWDERMGLIVFIREDERTRDTVRVFQVQRDKIVLSPSEIFPITDGTQTIRVDLRANVNYDISVPSEYEEWLSFTNERPDVLMVTAQQSLVGERDGEIIITDRNNPKLTAVLPVYQRDRDMVQFKEQTLEVERTGGTFELDVQDNITGDYELIIPKYATWIHEAPKTRALADSKVKIIVDENPESQIGRQAKLYLRGVGIRNGGEVFMSVPIQVTQKGRATLKKTDKDILKEIQTLMGLVSSNWIDGGTYNPCTFISDKIVKFALPNVGTGVLNGQYTTTVVPELVGDLTNVQEIALNGFLRGDIPVSIGSLPNLTKLTIDKRRKADVGFNRLPPELGGIESLKTLSINHDRYAEGEDLETMLDFIGDLTNLENLTITNCKYGEKMPESWRNLVNLKSLKLQGTGFVDVDPISDMVSLETLIITKDAISDLPDLSRLTKLATVDLSDNPNLTAIPASLMRVSSLTSITIKTNRIERLPEDWSALVNVVSLDLSNAAKSDYKIQGPLPSSMGCMTKLTLLNLRYNALEGQVPEEFKNLTELVTPKKTVTEGFVVEGNKFTSIASGVLSNWKKLTYLNLSDNHFIELPEDIVKMTSLEILVATNNEFTGELPANIGDLEKLTDLNLSRSLTKEFQSPGLGGFIPASITNLKNLKSLNLSGNNFIGPIPAKINDMTALEKIILNDNQLSGEIPLGITKLQNAGFKEIFLQNNNLTGYIPDAFRNLTKLNKLDLRNNNLQGTVPAGIVQGPGAVISLLQLSGNRLTGVLPQAVITVIKEKNWSILEQQPGYGLTLE